MSGPAGEQAEERGEEAIVIGAGPSGLATAAMLRRRGVAVRVLERGCGVGAAWRERYDQLRLNTVRWLSALPGMRLERSLGRWVSRDGYVDYLDRYAERHRLEVELGVEVERVERRDRGWLLRTSGGECWAPTLIVATGYYRVPRAPRWPGGESYRGRLLHAADYRSPAEFAGADVLVVGAGNSGTEIAQQLATGGAAAVRLAVRTPPNIVPRELLGLPTHPLSVLARPAPPFLLDRSTRVIARLLYGNLGELGLPPAPDGVHTTSLKSRPPVIDAGFVAAVRRGEIAVTAPLAGLDREEAVLADGRRLRPDAVIAAIGFEPDLRPLVGHLGVLDQGGFPLVLAPRAHPAAPQLYFVGFRPRLGGFLVDFGPEARRTARSVWQRARSRG